MLAFLVEFTFIIGTLMILAACGLGLIAPFAHRFPFVLLASPQAGLLLLTSATQLFYSIFYLPTGKALLIATAACLVITGCSLFVTGFRLHRQEFLLFILLTVLTSAVYAVANCASSIANGGPSLLYADGTDHLAYAHLADWMRDHAPSHDAAYRSEPLADPTLPYQSLPNIVFGMDPRMGAYTFVGIIGILRGVPSSFAYDSACAVALAAGVLGVAAVFTTRLFTFVTLALGLSLAHWYDFTQAGFFSKALAYPSALFTVGLFFLRWNDYRGWVIASLLVATAGSALMLSGFVTVLVILLLCMSAMFFRTLQSRRVELRDYTVLGLMAAFAVAVSGFFVRPYGGGFPHDPYKSLPTAFRALDIEGWITTTHMAQPIIVLILVFTVLATLSLAILTHTGASKR